MPALTVDSLWPGAVLDVWRAIGFVRDLGPLLNPRRLANGLPQQAG